MDTFEVKETKEALIQAVSQMAEREKTVLTLYYYEGLTLAEIGEILGVTESRVCQIHTKAVLQLRAKLADRPEGRGRRRAGPGHQGGPPGASRRRGPALTTDAARHRPTGDRRPTGAERSMPVCGRPGPGDYHGAVRRAGGPDQPGPSPHPAASTVAPHRGAAVGEQQPSEGAVQWPSSP